MACIITYLLSDLVSGSVGVADTGQVHQRGPATADVTARHAQPHMLHDRPVLTARTWLLSLDVLLDALTEMFRLWL